MKEFSVADPSLLFDKFLVHDGNVSRGASKGDPTQPEPKPERLPERRLGYPGSCELDCWRGHDQDLL
jgi:hypothetical protein